MPLYSLGTFMNARYESRDNNIVRASMNASYPLLPSVSNIRNWSAKFASNRAGKLSSPARKNDYSWKIIREEKERDEADIRLTKSGRLTEATTEPRARAFELARYLTSQPRVVVHAWNTQRVYYLNLLCAVSRLSSLRIYLTNAFPSLVQGAKTDIDRV